MKSIVSFLGGIIFTLVVLAGVGYFAVKAGIVPANAGFFQQIDLSRF
jgi:uncharacterized membrane protein AbrB (regulator of aidB expression)